MSWLNRVAFALSPYPRQPIIYLYCWQEDMHKSGILCLHGVCSTCEIGTSQFIPHIIRLDHSGSSRCCNVGRLSTCAASVAYNFTFVYIIHYRNVSALKLDACMQHTTQRHSGAGYSDHRTQTVVEIIYTSRSRSVSVERLAVGGVWITFSLL